MVKSSILTFAVTWLLFSAVFTANASPTARPWDTIAPLYEPTDAEAISDSYIVVLKDHVTSTQALTHCEWVGHVASQQEERSLKDILSSEAASGIRYTYDTPSWRGYSGRFSQKALEDIRRSPEV